VALITSPTAQTVPARRLALIGATLEAMAARRMKRRLGMIAEPYDQGPAGRCMRGGQVLTAGGLLVAFVGRRSRAAGAVAGTMLSTASALTRFGVFEAGKQSAADPKYTIHPQRQRLLDRQ
jgi:hypothetical protein